jgi:hypothetical protein
MAQTIAQIVTKKSMHQQGNDFAYWQTQSFAARIATLEDIRREYHTWKKDLQEIPDAQPGLQRIYRIIKL